MLSLIDQLSIVGFAGLLVWAGICDARTMAIPNRITFAIAALWPAHAAAALIGGMPVSGVAGGLAAGAGAFVLGAVLFHFRVLGGGDVKLFAATALWAGPLGLVPLVLVTAIAGGVLSLAVLAARVARPASGEPACETASPSPRATLSGRLRSAVKEPAPFGVAIAAGGLFVAMRLFESNAVTLTAL